MKDKEKKKHVGKRKARKWPMILLHMILYTSVTWVFLFDRFINALLVNDYGFLPRILLFAALLAFFIVICSIALDGAFFQNVQRIVISGLYLILCNGLILVLIGKSWGISSRLFFVCLILCILSVIVYFAELVWYIVRFILVAIQKRRLKRQQSCHTEADDGTGQAASSDPGTRLSESEDSRLPDGLVSNHVGVFAFVMLLGFVAFFVIQKLFDELRFSILELDMVTHKMLSTGWDRAKAVCFIALLLFFLCSVAYRAQRWILDRDKYKIHHFEEDRHE